MRTEAARRAQGKYWRTAKGKAVKRRYEVKQRQRLAEWRRAWRKRNRDKVHMYKRRYRQSHPAMVHAMKKRHYEQGGRFTQILRRHGLTLDEYHAMLERQGECCAICREVIAPVGPKTHVDHDHVTDRVRGLLCFNCNIGLGKFKDNPVALRAAAAYLEAHHA